MVFPQPWKLYDITTCYITLLWELVTSWQCPTTMQFFIEIMSTLKAIKSHLKGHMINRILHSWSVHMKLSFMEDSLHVFKKNRSSGLIICQRNRICTFDAFVTGSEYI